MMNANLDHAGIHRSGGCAVQVNRHVSFIQCLQGCCGLSIARTRRRKRIWRLMTACWMQARKCFGFGRVRFTSSYWGVRENWKWKLTPPLAMQPEFQCCGVPQGAERCCRVLAV